MVDEETLCGCANWKSVCLEAQTRQKSKLKLMRHNQGNFGPKKRKLFETSNLFQLTVGSMIVSAVCLLCSHPIKSAAQRAHRAPEILQWVIIIVGCLCPQLFDYDYLLKFRTQRVPVAYFLELKKQLLTNLYQRMTARKNAREKSGFLKGRRISPDVGVNTV